MTQTKELLFNNDIIFKNTFNTTDVLKRLLEETLDLKVSEIFTANTEMPIEYVKEKRKILDLIVITDKGIINVEVNNDYKEDMYIRNFLYFCKLLGSHLKKENKNYANVTTHIQLNLTWNLQKYFPNINMEKRKKIEFCLTDPKSGEKVLEEMFKIVNINMDYYEKMCYSKNKEKPFLKLLAAQSIKEMETIAKGDEIMSKLVKKVKDLNIDPTLAREIAEMAAIENEAEIWAETRYTRGKEHGIKQGISQGIKQRSLEIAKNMLNLKMDISTITKATGLSKQAIENLK